MADFVIIGSGVSGGRIAQELTAAGTSCLMLKAGSWFEAPDFPGDEMSLLLRD